MCTRRIVMSAYIRVCTAAAPAPITPTVDPNVELLVNYEEAQAKIYALPATIPDPSSQHDSDRTQTTTSTKV
jgi:hypothetical protein